MPAVPPILRIIVAVNAYASSGLRRDVSPRVTVALIAAGHTVTTRGEINFDLLRSEVAAELVPGVDVLVVVGGDRMVSLGTNLVAGTTKPLAIVSFGTGNDLARGLRIPVDDTDPARVDQGVVQFVVPLAITAGVFGWLGGAPQTATQGGVTTTLWLQNAGFVFVPFIVASAFAAWFGLNDIATMKASFAGPT